MIQDEYSYFSGFVGDTVHETTVGRELGRQEGKLLNTLFPGNGSSATKIRLYHARHLVMRDKHGEVIFSLWEKRHGEKHKVQYEGRELVEVEDDFPVFVSLNDK